MKITGALLQGLLLIASSCSRDICRQQNQQANYYIYNVNVEVKSYYCFLDIGNKFSCEDFNNSKAVMNNHQNILSKCRQKQEAIYSKLGIRVRLCEVSAKANLLENKITLVGNKTCHYHLGNCWDSNFKKYVFWYYPEKCQNLIKMYEGYVDVWTVGQNEMKFIHNDRISLMLIEKTKLCDVDIWKTHHDGTVASTNYINSLRGSLLKLEDVLPKECDITVNNNDPYYGSKNMQNKRYYIYTYPATVTIFYCVAKYGSSCEEIGYDETNSIYNWTSLRSRCSQFFDFSSYKDSQVKVCQKTHKTDLEKDAVIELHSKCKYSSGICQEYRVFWNYTDVCSAIKYVYKDYVEIQTNANRRTLIHGYNSLKLNLVRQGKLCGENVWYTDQYGFVASEKELQFSHSGNIVFSKENNDKSFGITLQTEINVGNIPHGNQNNRVSTGRKIPNYKLDNTASPPQNKKNKPGDSYVPEQSDPSIGNNDQFIDSELQHIHSATSLPNKMDEDDSPRTQNEENNYLQSLQIYIALFISFCVFWYLFNVIVNFVSLKKLSKGQTSKSQTYLMNCMSQSLTTRYLYFSRKDADNPEEGPAVSVDNELYNKPVSLKYPLQKLKR